MSSLYILAAVQYLHVLCAIAWLGGALTMRFLGTRALREGTYPASMLTGAQRYFAIAAGLTIVLGIARGVLQGVVPGSAYANTFIAGLVLAVFLAFWDARLLGPTYRAAGAAEGESRAALVGRLTTLSTVSLAVFAVILALMIAMRFGY